MNNANRIRAKFALALGRQSVGHGCPPLEEVVAWHEKALNKAQAKQMQAHVAQCDHCFALWSGLVELAPAERQHAASEPGERVRWWHFAAPAMALGVVAVSLWIGLLGSAPLPVYSLDVRGGMDVRGGGADASLKLTDNTLLQILVTPASAVDGQIEAIGYAQSPAGLVPLTVTMDVTNKGVASLEAVIGSDITIAPDTRRLLIVVGREGELPTGNELLDALGDRSQIVEDDWQAFSVEIRE